MFLFGDKIARLEKFIVKALSKAITAGDSVIALYEEGGQKVEKLKMIIDKLKKVKAEIEFFEAENE